MRRKDDLFDRLAAALLRPTRADIIEAAADVYDCSRAQAESDLIASDWFICPRVAAWLRRHGYTL